VNLGFYTHIEASFDDSGRCRVPAHMGVLIQELARQAGRVTFYGHEATGTGIEDFELSEPLVRSVNLGPRRRFPTRTFLPASSLRMFRPLEHELDAMLIVGPSPLLPHLVRRLGSVPVALHIWGDYGAWQPRPDQPRWRNFLIRRWVQFYSMQQERVARGILAFVQAPELAETVKGADVRVVPFSSVSRSAVDSIEPSTPEWPSDKGHSDPVRLVYSGRIVREKGLFEAVRCLRVLREWGYTAELQLLGWEDPRDPTVRDLVRYAEEFGVSHQVKMLGYRKAGPELLRAYTDADVFVLPTYWEGLPRAMQEAMAVGLPVVASAVGGIAEHLRDRESAMLVEPRNVEQLAAAIRDLIDDPELRRTVALRGRAWALSFTVESGAELVVGAIARLVASARAGS
jgi:glycosyltransferase involved in cell wall biosynthesis